MQDLITVVLPVFFVIGFGYLAARRGLFNDSAIDGLMTFAQKFAVPFLLFRAISTLDLSQSFNLALLTSFYTGAFTGFTLGILGGRFLFKRSWEDSIAIGFCGLFSNSLLLGLPISERAYGVESLAGNFAIIAVHSPICYGLGITAMEIARNRGKTGFTMVKAILKAMFSNALILGIALGFVVNLSGITLPVSLRDAIDLMVRAALPAALFGLGGVLNRYRPEGDIVTSLYIVTASLVVHPLIAYSLGVSFGLSDPLLRSAVVTAAMAPGVNAYVFADMYGAAKRVAATSVLLGTALSILTVWVWLHILP
ncbi:MAG: AEC family transporter [Mangrovicoccus sp.]